MASSLVELLLPASLELVECLSASGELRAGTFGDGALRVPAACVGGASGSSGTVDALFFFRSKLGWLDDLEGARELGRDCSRSDCADAAAARLDVERPACCAALSSFASTYELREEARDAVGRTGAIVKARLGVDAGKPHGPVRE